MIVASHSVTIARPIEDVFRFVGEHFFEHAVQWSPATIKLTKTAPGPMGIGTTGYEVQKMNGKQKERHLAIREWKPNEMIRMISMESGAGGHYQAIYRFEPIGNGTKVTVEIETDIEGLKFHKVPFLAAREFRKEMENRVGTLLKRAVERGLLTIRNNDNLARGSARA